MTLFKRNKLKPVKTDEPEPFVKENLFSEKDPIYLTILDRFKPLIVKQGYDYDTLRFLLKVKMAVNERDLSKVQLNQAKASGKSVKLNSDGTVKTPSFKAGLILQFVIAAFLSIFIFMPVPVIYRFLIVFTMLFLMMTISLIGQLGVVLMNHEDLLVLPVRPIDPRTLSLSRVIQVAIYQISSFITFAAPPTIFSFIALGPIAGFTTLLSIFMLSLFILFLSLALYLAAARHFSGEKLRDMIAYAQIVMIFVNFLGYQLTNVITQFLETEIALSPLMMLFPTFGFAAPIAWVSEGYHLLYVIGTGLAIIGTLALYLYYRQFSPVLEQKLITLVQDKGEANRESFSYRNRLAAILFPSPTERAFFKFCWQQLKNERNLKIELYPTIMMYNAIPYLIYIQMFGGQISDEFRLPAHLSLYMLIAFTPTMLFQVQFSDYYEAAYIFRVLPESKDGPYARAIAKALFARYILPLLPIHLLVMALTEGLPGFLGVINLGCLSLLFLLITAMTAKSTGQPFSRQRVPQANSAGCSTVILLSIIALIFGGIQFVIDTFVPVLRLGYTALLLLITFLTIRFYKGDRTYINII